MWDEAHNHSKNVCGVYVDIWDNLEHEFDITFEVSIQLDDLLPLSGMSILPNCVISDIELEIKNRIQGNLVYFQVNPEALFEEYARTTTAFNDATLTVAGTATDRHHFFRSVKEEISSCMRKNLLKLEMKLISVFIIK